MTAGIFASLGVWAGTASPGDKNNPRGYFEHITLRDHITKGILAAHGYDPLGVQTFPPRSFNPSIKFNHALTLRQTVDAIIRDDGYVPGYRWLYKDPKMSLVWRMYDDAFPNAIWIVVSRDRDDFVRSCLKTNFMVRHSTDPSFWDRVAQQYEQRLADIVEGVATCYEVRTDDVVQGDFSDIERICRAHGLDYNSDSIAAFVSPQFWNSHAK